MNKSYLTTLAWIAGTGLTLLGAIVGGARYIAWQQINFDRLAMTADSIRIDVRNIKSELSILKPDFYATRTNVNTLRGSYNALDHSYVRTLEKYLKDKDEKDKYQKEKIQMLEEELEKKRYSDSAISTVKHSFKYEKIK